MINRKRIRYLAAYPGEATPDDVSGLIGLLEMQRDAMTVMSGVGEPMVARITTAGARDEGDHVVMQAAVALPLRDDRFFEVLDVGGDGESPADADGPRPRLRTQASRLPCGGGSEVVLAFRLFEPGDP